jgi:hypothetical protein
VITFSRLGWYGQLGNQLFQYATLRAVAESIECEMRIPMRFDQPKQRGLVELEPLSIRCQALTAADLAQMRNTYKERWHGFDPAVFEQPDWTDFAGFFQTEKYFKHLRAELLEEFAFRAPIAEHAARYVAAIRAQAGAAPLVAIHVRRGDYLTKPDYARILPLAWYLTAMETFDRFQPVYLVFSDDPAWCMENLGAASDREPISRRPATLQVAGPDHWHDLAVMALCDHFIIAGSSFSWWGAWLSQSEGKIVVAPERWFGPKSGIDESDIVPEGWRKL